MTSPPDSAGCSGAGRVARTVVVLVASLSVLLSVGPIAAAYWAGAGSGSGLAVAGTLASPVGVTVPGTATSDVPVTWTEGSGPLPPSGYYVTRHAAGTSTWACLSSPTAVLQGTTCTDSGVPDGEYSYTVTAVFRSWTASSTSSGAVVVAGPSGLVFTTPVADTTAGALITPGVTIALGASPPGATLSGQTTVATDAAGVATFDTLSIDEPGTGYTLTATASGLASPISNPFNVTAPPLGGAARTYSVLAGTSVTSTGETTISGDVGVSPGTSVVGIDPGSVGGDIHAGDAGAATARTALADAYADLSIRTADGGELILDLGGSTLTAGVYHSTAALGLTGTLTLDAQGDPDALFIFQTDAAFNTAAASTVILINGAQAANVYWVVAGAAGIGADSVLSGNIVAQGAITLGAGTALIGRALSLDAVTLAANTIRFTTAPPPTISIDGGAAAVTKDTTAQISGSSSAAASSPVTVTVEAQTHVTTVGQTGTWSVPPIEVTAGTHQVVAKVREANGNGSTAAQTLTVEINPPRVVLGSASTFSVLAGTAVVNTGGTTMTGDLGVSPGTQVTGFGPGTYGGTLHAGDLTAEVAQADFLAALNDASSRTPHTQIIGDLGTRTFHVGVHHSTAALALTGTVTLDAEGDPNAVFIFQTDAAFNTAAASSVNLINGAQASNVFWSVTGAAGTGANSDLAGTILAGGAITLGAGSSLAGQALSRDTVTLATNILTGATPAPAARFAAGAGPTANLGGTPEQDAASAPAPIGNEPATPAPGSTGQNPVGSESPTPGIDPSPSPDPTPTAQPSPAAESPSPTPDPSASTTA